MTWPASKASKTDPVSTNGRLQVPSLDEILRDYPPGPLDRYRKAASFDHKKMMLFVEGESVLLFKVIYTRTIKSPSADQSQIQIKNNKQTQFVDKI